MQVNIKTAKITKISPSNVLLYMVHTGLHVMFTILGIDDCDELVPVCGSQRLYFWICKGLAAEPLNLFGCLHDIVV